MVNIWSEKKYVNLAINILLFLLGMNFMHYAQILVPIICAILFIDNRFKFKVNNVITFIILCLFGISFLIFARNQGLFAFIGLFIPMAYYIGSNIKEVNESNVRTVIYIFTFGMITHVLLNFDFDLYRRGFRIFFSTSHFDIWTQSDISETATSINYVFLYGTIYYMLFHEKNKMVRIASLLVFMLSSFYCIALGERTIILILLISFFVSFIINYFVLKTKKINTKTILKVGLIIIAISIVIGVLYVLNIIDDYNYSVLDMRLFGKFINKGLKTERLNILIETIKNAPQHLWGNNEISEIVGIMPHDLWSDAFDIAGIVTLFFLIAHTISFLIVVFRIYSNSKVSNDFKLFVFPLLLAILLQMLLEPIISGSSVFLIVVIIVEALVEKLNIYVK